MAASSSLVLEQSTKEIFNPNSDATCLKYLFVPETEENQIKWKEYFIKKCSFLVDMNTYIRKCQSPIKIQLKPILLRLNSLVIMYSEEYKAWILNYKLKSQIKHTWYPHQMAWSRECFSKHTISTLQTLSGMLPETMSF